MTNNKTIITIKKCANISFQKKDEIFALHLQYFDNTTFEKFNKDFTEKQWCIIIQDIYNKIVGYSTIQLIFDKILSLPVLVLFSGDTLVSKEYWNTNALVIGFSNFIEYISQLFPDHKKYWLLITKGYRTYRFLPLYFKQYYPAYNIETPKEISILMNSICTKKFGDRYDSQKGLVLSNDKNDFLRPEMAVVPPGKKKDPNVCYFLRRNPNYHKGDELVCLTSIEKENIINRLFYRYIKKYPVSIDK
ncbi:hypothetical protein A2526_04745 [candidate division WOR-1 bacterium RIFOXYD2_FULL_36_8]|uniref:N-acetyltransferase domain-containing protein n=1 Tax=candidate division WOR-1 bacterium RIFOXYB2_FULL_36_35 TaxID=1802578 RepID=A0A1F4S678_UNCSA|nr:MAG: hypothetical protein A2230_01350 [candidate division WOR-1 bacterium RIFOXYA2_FULL_36_21]OGC14379.1 MAG: hypothetical protein A2282_08005 [candidate division WOR-1 bacterium RIFOXYA12_FULL_36_13]OGC15945.1 MAG: hypothetical protein A2290_06820 [candidate division WOR-1 bacterium RIFOXYB2_FULL_36_35]OGC37271.1 MAG: hypothetical protein A2526_04745 [candidate division WOR-1 bacterium RIFOXYD2_FULL_36_8]